MNAQRTAFRVTWASVWVGVAAVLFGVALGVAGFTPGQWQWWVLWIAWYVTLTLARRGLFGRAKDGVNP